MNIHHMYATKTAWRFPVIARRWVVMEVAGGQMTRVPGMLFWRRKQACVNARALNDFAPLFRGDRQFRIVDLRKKGQVQ